MTFLIVQKGRKLALGFLLGMKKGLTGIRGDLAGLERGEEAAHGCVVAAYELPSLYSMLPPKWICSARRCEVSMTIYQGKSFTYFHY